jgi:hypothetical protein
MSTIVYATKRGVGGRLILKRWIKKRKSDIDARRDIRVQTYRRLWWWDASRWDQRHGV